MGNRFLKVIQAPKNMEINSISSFIRVFNFIFDLAGKEKPNYFLSFSKVERCDVTGLLLLYKMLEYSVNKKCFHSPETDVVSQILIRDYITEYGFFELIKSLMNNPDAIDLRPYKKLRISSDEKVLIAPIALIRSDNLHATQIIKNHYGPKISSFYQDEGVQQMILSVYTEILHNFWAHATSDTKSIIVGYGTKNYFEIACCDNGYGIDGTMNARFPNKNPKFLVKKAMENGVTSKVNSNHMGYGLWYINEVVSKARGKLTIVSNNVMFRNEYGKVSVSDCPFWKGCIVSLKLPLSNPISIKDIKVDKSNDVNINFI